MHSSLSPDTRFWSKVDPCRTDGCMVWTATKTKGYGRFSIGLKSGAAHHYLAGKPPEGLVYDHLCRERSCVNPEHLEAVTNRENLRRGLKGILSTHCPQGHAYTAANTYVHPNGKKDCRECSRARGRRRPSSSKNAARTRAWLAAHPATD